MRGQTLEQDGRQLFVVSREYGYQGELPVLYGKMYQVMGLMLLDAMKNHREYVVSVARIDDATPGAPVFTAKVIVEVEEVG